MDVGNFYIRFKISLKAGANFIIPDKSAVLEHEVEIFILLHFVKEECKSLKNVDEN